MAELLPARTCRVTFLGDHDPKPVLQGGHWGYPTYSTLSLCLALVEWIVKSFGHAAAIRTLNLWQSILLSRTATYPAFESSMWHPFLQIFSKLNKYCVLDIIIFINFKIWSHDFLKTSAPPPITIVHSSLFTHPDALHVYTKMEGTPLWILRSSRLLKSGNN